MLVLPIYYKDRTQMFCLRTKFYCVLYIAFSKNIFHFSKWPAVYVFATNKFYKGYDPTREDPLLWAYMGFPPNDDIKC